MSTGFAVKRFSPIVEERIKTLDRLQFYEGPVRSGKTQASLMSLALYIAKYPVKTGIMSGNTIGSVTRNCIKSRMGLLDLIPDAKLVKRANADQIIVPTSHGEVTIYLFGADNASSDGPLRGLTADFWYADEITKHHLNFVEEAMARLAASEHPFMIWTSNPDNPHHKVYTQYTDRFKAFDEEQNRDFGGYHEFHFRLEDNPIMTKAKIDRLKLSYTGVEYRRKILGERCVAEGLVYQFFDEAKHVREPPEDIRARFASIDFGVSHPTAMCVFGYSASERLWYVMDEWRGTPEQSAAMTTKDYFDTFSDILLRYDPHFSKMAVTIDYGGGGEALAREFEKNRWIPQTPEKAVLDGISMVARLINTWHLFISPNCKKLLEEIHLYRWDERASERGETKPIKLDDDLCDALRYGVATFIEPRIRK